MPTTDVSDNAPTSNPFTRMYDYDGSGNMIYEGWAVPGTPASSPAWAIRKYTYSGGLLQTSQWAYGTSALSFVWNNRASFPYA